MRLAYIDESYDSRTYWFGALLVPEATDAALQREVLGIAPRYGRHGVSPDAEIHGYPLWNGVGEWQGLDPRLRVDVLRRTLRAAIHAEGNFVFVAIDRRTGVGMTTLDYARGYATARLLRRLEQACARIDERCLLIFDEETRTAKNLFEIVHKHHRQRLMSGEDPCFVERPVIAPSHTSPGIQVADVAIYLRQRQHCKPVEADRRAHRARAWLLDSIRHLVLHDEAP